MNECVQVTECVHYQHLNCICNTWVCVALNMTFKSVQRGVEGGNAFMIKFEPVHEISNNVVCLTSKASDQTAHTCSLIRAFASRSNIL